MYSFTPTRAITNTTATMNQLIETSFVGPMHNRIMDDVTKLPSFPKYTDREVYATAKARIELYYASNNLGKPDVIPFDDVERNILKVMAANNDMKPYFSELLSERQIVQKQYDFLIEINGKFLNAKDPNKVGSDLFDIQQKVHVEPGLSFNQKALVFGAAMVGISSAPYWYAGLRNPNSPWGQGDDPPPAAAPWWVRGLRDLAGFVGGFVVGELISGGNPVVGVAAGAATAAGCSAKD